MSIAQKTLTFIFDRVPWLVGNKNDLANGDLDEYFIRTFLDHLVGRG